MKQQNNYTVAICITLGECTYMHCNDWFYLSEMGTETANEVSK